MASVTLCPRGYKVCDERVCVSVHVPSYYENFALKCTVFVHVDCGSGFVPSGSFAMRYSLPVHIVVSTPRIKSAICDCIVAVAINSDPQRIRDAFARGSCSPQKTKGAVLPFPYIGNLAQQSHGVLSDFQPKSKPLQRTGEIKCTTLLVSEK